MQPSVPPLKLVKRTQMSGQLVFNDSNEDESYCISGFPYLRLHFLRGQNADNKMTKYYWNATATF